MGGELDTAAVELSIKGAGDTKELSTSKEEAQAEQPAEGVHSARASADFVASEGLTTQEADALLKQWGRNELQEKGTPKWLVFVKILYQPMPIMIWIAVAIELGLQNWIDAGILLAIQIINAVLGWWETVKAADAVAALKASLKPVATVKRDGKWQNLDAVLLVPGDLVLLGAGSNVPADCIVNKGRIEVDQSALTGESLPVSMYGGSAAKMGSTVVRGEVEATVEATGKNTFFGKTATLLQAVGGIGHLQMILMRIVLVLVAISILLCTITLIYLCVYGKEPFKEALTFVVVLLVVSIPIAIEIVCTATLALGSRQLSSHGAIVTRLSSIEEMAGMNMLCSDKTGTLTLNKMVIQDDCPVYTPGMDQKQVLQFAALAAKWHEPPRDALDTLVLTSADLPALDQYVQEDFVPFDPTIKRTEATIRAPDGSVFKTTKGAPHIILKLLDVDREEVTKRVNWKVMDLGRRGIRCLAVARTNPEGLWQLLGILTFLDPPRSDTKATIERAMEYGVDVKMITGDHTVIAKETARMLGMGTCIADASGLPSLDADGKVPKDLGKKYGKMILEADGFAQVFPEHKYLIVEALRQEGFAVGMTGDGVNDAPALKRADVGIAVQGATDAARAAADMVLTREGLSVIVEAITISRCIFARMKNFINYRIACTLQLLVFFFIAVFALHPADYNPTSPDFFKMPVLMLMLITVLNDGTLISVAYDHVVPSNKPEKWNLKVVWLISTVLASIAMLSSLLLLWGALDSANPDGVFAAFGLPPIAYAHVITLMYLKVSLSDFLTLFSARTHSGFFWSQRPGWVLVVCALAALCASTTIACLWPTSSPDKIPTAGLLVNPDNGKVGDVDYSLWPLWTWIYCLVWWFVQDATKVAAYWVMRRFNVFNINTASMVNMRGATSFGGNPLARASAGRVEGKLLEQKVDNVLQRLSAASQRTGNPSLKRASQDLALARTSVQLMRASMGATPPPGDVEGGSSQVAQVQQQVEQVERVLQHAPTLDRQEIQVAMAEVRATAARVAEVERLARKSA